MNQEFHEFYVLFFYRYISFLTLSFLTSNLTLHIGHFDNFSMGSYVFLHFG